MLRWCTSLSRRVMYQRPVARQDRWEHVTETWVSKSNCTAGAIDGTLLVLGDDQLVMYSPIKRCWSRGSNMLQRCHLVGSAVLLHAHHPRTHTRTRTHTLPHTHHTPHTHRTHAHTTTTTTTHIHTRTQSAADMAEVLTPSSVEERVSWESAQNHTPLRVDCTYHRAAAGASSALQMRERKRWGDG
ncbi:hypothetical protein EVAR_34137_1 [Eumeta japonica]|uniref:Uncharacterized protein n=1 Tax=Eumeta variegata TaxID=151549 RepID=A0A4C1WJE1_EUMVA|nr:hypothetical protein EVAR_34137_1 [Eumeta japonica]